MSRLNTLTIVTLIVFIQTFGSFCNALECKSCPPGLNKTLIITCDGKDICAESVTPNCTLKINCKEQNLHSTVKQITLMPTGTISATPSTSKSSSSVSHSVTTTSSKIKSTSAPKPTATQKPTAKPTTHAKPHPKIPKSSRRFDAASFIGGILLCGGVILLVYIFVRCYKSKPNYSRL